MVAIESFIFINNNISKTSIFFGWKSYWLMSSGSMVNKCQTIKLKDLHLNHKIMLFPMTDFQKWIQKRAFLTALRQSRQVGVNEVGMRW